MNRRLYLVPAYLAAVALSVGLLAGRAAGQDNYEWKDGKWVASAKPELGTAEGEVALVREYLEGGQAKKAVKLAKKFRKRYPDSKAYEELCLLAGKAEIARGRYFQGFEWFEKQLDVFPAGRFSMHALEAEYNVAEAFLTGTKRIALGFIKLGATDEGLEILSRIADHAPGTDIAARSLMRIADYHYNKGDWFEAAGAYDAFVSVFPKSRQTPYAALQAARATYASFSGIKFDETPLLDARQRFVQFAETYPAHARKANVAAMVAQIDQAQANKLFETGQFYERTKRPGAAVYYYKLLIQQYPGSSWTAGARTALQILGDVKAARPQTNQLNRTGSRTITTRSASSTRPARRQRADAPAGGANGGQAGDKTARKATNP